MFFPLLWFDTFHYFVHDFSIHYSLFHYFMESNHMQTLLFHNISHFSYQTVVWLKGSPPLMNNTVWFQGFLSSFSAWALLDQSSRLSSAAPIALPHLLPPAVGSSFAENQQQWGETGRHIPTALLLLYIVINAPLSYHVKFTQHSPRPRRAWGN